MVAITTVTAVPADPDALATFPWLHSLAHKVDSSDDFVSGHTRILNTGPLAFLDQRIAVTNTTRLNLVPHPARLRLGNISLDQPERSASTRDCNCPHRCSHRAPTVLLSQKPEIRIGG